MMIRPAGISLNRRGFYSSGNKVSQQVISCKKVKVLPANVLLRACMLILLRKAEGRLKASSLLK
jgi:hypothetical protein